FTRDKDGMFNQMMSYLPPATMTYDIYSVNGQGTSGQFRPYRNDYGSVFDPETESDEKTNSYAIEGGVGNLFELGVDYAKIRTKLTSGPWEKYVKEYSAKENNSIYEDLYFR